MVEAAYTEEPEQALAAAQGSVQQLPLVELTEQAAELGLQALAEAEAHTDKSEVQQASI